MSQTAAVKYALIWRRDGSEGIRWDIRGIREDGSFYGEIRYDSPDPAKRCGTSLSGTLPSEDAPRCAEILRHFHTRPGREAGACFAMLWRWAKSLHEGEAVVLYQLGDELKSDDAKHFVELKRLLEKQISKYYPLIVEPRVTPREFHRGVQ